MPRRALQLIAENKATRNPYLDLGCCGLATVPDLSDMLWLETLILSNVWWDLEKREWMLSKNKGANNELSSIEVGKLPVSLRKLYIGGDYHTSWSIVNWNFLRKMTHLESLYLGYNQITDGDFLRGLIYLETLYLGYNQIKHGDFLGGLTRLQSLDLSSNQITDGDFFSELTNLQSLDLSSNQIKDFNFVKKLTKLKSLYIGDSQVKNGNFLRRLMNLEHLDLRSNQITDGDFLRELKRLQILNLSNNQIKSGDFLQELANLRILNLSNNQVKSRGVLEGLTNLRILFLRNNQIESGDFLKNLTQLQYLDIRHNRVTSVEFLQNLTELQTLDLGNNYIKSGEFLRNLTQLQTLYLSHNQISNIEPLLPLIQKGIPIASEKFHFDGINIFNNPIIHPPIEIIAQGNSAILRYFEDLEQQGEDQIYEAKLLLIGEGGAGKTTLCKKLFDPYAPMPEEEKDRTKGIDIHPLHFDIPGKTDKQFRLNIWDFAGQGKYQSAHSFFFTHRSLYVLVDDTRTLNEDDAYRTLYNNWLQTAELFGGNSPVLVLHNEKKGCARMGFNLGGFQERFEFVHGELFRINLGGGDTDKINDLRCQIERQALALPHIGDRVPKNWVKVREAIETEQQNKPYIPVERYREICAAAGIEDPERQSDLSHYFHDLGVFLHFQNNPLLRRDVFLQNEWVTNAVYKILDDDQIASEQRGRFDKNDLVRLWQGYTYRDRHAELLALMLQFELGYQVQDTETYVCPQLLPGDLPDYNLGQGIPLQLKYEYVFMPKGLLYRLIVRLHRHIAQGQSAVWNAGVVLERTGAIAEIAESLDRRTISIRATGRQAKELVNIIHDTLEGLHQPFGERLKVTVRIPCNCRVCGASDKPHFYDKTNLDNRLSKGKMTVECDVSFEDVPVRGLLEGVFAKPNPVTFTEIRRLFKEGETEQALEALCALNLDEAYYLKARYSTVKKEHLGGRLEFEAFERVINQVNVAGLHLLDQKERLEP